MSTLLERKNAIFLGTRDITGEETAQAFLTEFEGILKNAILSLPDKDRAKFPQTTFGLIVKKNGANLLVLVDALVCATEEYLLADSAEIASRKLPNTRIYLSCANACTPLTGAMEVEFHTLAQNAFVEQCYLSESGHRAYQMAEAFYMMDNLMRRNLNPIDLLGEGLPLENGRVVCYLGSLRSVNPISIYMPLDGTDWKKHLSQGLLTYYYKRLGKEVPSRIQKHEELFLETLETTPSKLIPEAREQTVVVSPESWLYEQGIHSLPVEVTDQGFPYVNLPVRGENKFSDNSLKPFISGIENGDYSAINICTTGNDYTLSPIRYLSPQMHSAANHLQREMITRAHQRVFITFDGWKENPSSYFDFPVGLEQFADVLKEALKKIFALASEHFCYDRQRFAEPSFNNLGSIGDNDCRYCRKIFIYSMCNVDILKGLSYRDRLEDVLTAICSDRCLNQQPALFVNWRIHKIATMTNPDTILDELRIRIEQRMTAPFIVKYQQEHVSALRR